MIRPVQLRDALQLAEIYNYYILNTVITFEVDTIDAKEMEKRLQANNPKLPWLVYEENEKILGYAYSKNWKARSAYKQSVEVSIYLNHQNTSKGIGTKLYSQLIEQLKEMGIHAIIGGIALPNPTSLALHEKLGFEKVAHFKEVGFKFNQWIDVGYWELLSPKLKIVNYEPKYKSAFKEINKEWIDKYFKMEDSDYKSLDYPDENIIQKGGHILVALYNGIPAGVCALVKLENHRYEYELAKMGVRPNYHKKGIGKQLGLAIIQKAKDIKANNIFLESNTILAPAINLYRQLGFIEVTDIETPYARCNIQMELILK